MFHVYEFEVFEDEGWFLALPFDFLGGTQGESYAEACEMAADWLRVECEHRAMHGEGFPPATFGNEPTHGGTVVVVGVEASRDTVRKVTASEAARHQIPPNAQICAFRPAFCDFSAKSGTK